MQKKYYGSGNEKKRVFTRFSVWILLVMDINLCIEQSLKFNTEYGVIPCLKKLWQI